MLVSEVSLEAPTSADQEAAPAASTAARTPLTLPVYSSMSLGLRERSARAYQLAQRTFTMLTLAGFLVSAAVYYGLCRYVSRVPATSDSWLEVRDAIRNVSATYGKKSEEEGPWM